MSEVGSDHSDEEETATDPEKGGADANGSFPDGGVEPPLQPPRRGLALKKKKNVVSLDCFFSPLAFSQPTSLRPPWLFNASHLPPWLFNGAACGTRRHRQCGRNHNNHACVVLRFDRHVVNLVPPTMNGTLARGGEGGLERLDEKQDLLGEKDPEVRQCKLSTSALPRVESACVSTP